MTRPARARRRAVLAALAQTALVGLGGCAVRAGYLTVASTAQLPVAFEEIHIVEGRNCRYIVLGIPLGPIVPSLGDAVADALRQEPSADSLINLSIYRDDRFFALFQQTCLRVKGMAASTSPGPAAAADATADPESARAPGP